MKARLLGLGIKNFGSLTNKMKKLFDWIMNEGVTLFIMILLFIKILMANDIHSSLRNDPMENWVALGMIVLLNNSLKKNS